jgi:hypothetical protein
MNLAMDPSPHVKGLYKNTYSAVALTARNRAIKAFEAIEERKERKERKDWKDR